MPSQVRGAASPVRRRTRDARGAVAVEAALVIPLLMVLLCGIVEMALLLRDGVAETSAVRVGARIASAAAGAGPGVCQASANPPPCTPANAPALAQAAADAIQRSGSAMPKDDIEYILVYDANLHGYPMPSTNTTLTCTANCVKYSWDQSLDRFRYASGSWASTSINACVNDPARSALGVAMVVHHGWVTGLFGSGVTMTERSVMQFEPLTSEQCKPGTHP
jgi:hypothetical protein